MLTKLRTTPNNLSYLKRPTPVTPSSYVQPPTTSRVTPTLARELNRQRGTLPGAGRRGEADWRRACKWIAKGREQHPLKAFAHLNADNASALRKNVPNVQGYLVKWTDSFKAGGIEKNGVLRYNIVVRRLRGYIKVNWRPPSPGCVNLPS